MNKNLSHRTVENEEPEQRMQEVKEVAVCLIGFRKGCRCNDCRKASTAYSKQIKEKASQRFKADPSSLKKHGHYGYQIGCRCDVCKLVRAQMVSKLEQKKIENFERTGVFPNEAIKHGMEIAYRNGCRCKECKKALYNKASQRFKADPSVLKKHGYYGYQIGCRCDACKNAAKLRKSIISQKNKEHFKKTGTFLSKKTKHGSGIAFNIGCRCADCKKIGTKISDEIKEKAIKKFNADPSSLKKHGEYGYQIGCRCDLCEKWNKKQQFKNQVLNGLVVGEAVCLIGYRDGCRCTDCKKAQSAASKQRLERAIQRFKADPSSLKRHGYYGYQLGCRCDTCKTGISLQVSKRNQKRKSTLEHS